MIIDIMESNTKSSETYTYNVRKSLSSILSNISTYRNKNNKVYNTTEDFMRCNPESKRVVIIGCTGAGKSTLLNIMGGWKFVQNDNFEWDWYSNENQAPLFKSDHGVHSLTQNTCFANLNWFGDKEKSFIKNYYIFFVLQK